ncbi:MAG: ABC transporter ATP-binding protein [Acidobacteria bacterium]|nr:ABC transporter ATP-binding protein [Acidobacteriota bacterium]MBV9068001.1 ABC transporter ATP-binding protein [Acidobacteriota bacterium]MBV9188646.1 ABC transporter ATP-binding protein [Acidobacteriota bacterium]
MNGIRVEALTKAYRPLGKVRPVLKGVDLTIAPGEVVGLIGPNGAGKTTLMSCIVGFLNADTGSITIDGRSNDDLDVRRRTGFVPERMNFDRRASGGAFLRYMARLAGVPHDRVRARVDELLARLALTEASDKRLSQYSRGMLQRIGMAQALMLDPDFLFLDEPTSGLDPNGVFLVRDLIAEEKARGAAVLLNSHQLAEIEKVCDRVLFLKDGVIARDEALREVAKITITVTLLPGSYDVATVTAAVGGVLPKNDTVTANVATEGEIAQLVSRIVGTGAGVIDVRRRTADLESIFRGES